MNDDFPAMGYLCEEEEKPTDFPEKIKLILGRIEIKTPTTLNLII